MKRSLMWSVLSILAIVCVGLFAFAQQGPPGINALDTQLMHTYTTTIGAVALFTVGVIAVGLSLLVASKVFGARLRPETVALMMLIASVLMARLASYISATRRASSPESHYRNSRVSLSGV